LQDGLRIRSLLWICLLLPLLGLADTVPGRLPRAYDHALTLFHHGHLRDAQQAAAEGCRAFQRADEGWAERFLILQAEAMLSRGHYRETQEILSRKRLAASDPGERVRALVIEALAQEYMGNPASSRQNLEEAEKLCSGSAYPQCGYLLKLQGGDFLVQRDYPRAKEFTQRAIERGEQTGDRYLTRRALLNMGVICYHKGESGEAEEWDRRAYREAEAAGDRDTQFLALENLTTHSMDMGDPDAARTLIEQAAQEAEAMGDDKVALKLLHTLGEMAFSQWRLEEAEDAYRKALGKAEITQDRYELAYNLDSLATTLILQGRAKEAEEVLSAYRSLANAANQINISFLAARIRGLEGRNSEEEAMLRALLEGASDPQRQIVVNTELAATLEREQRAAEAESVYKAAIARFEAELARCGSFAAQVQLKYRASTLFSGAIRHFARAGQGEAALRLADRFFSQSYDEKPGATAAVSKRPAIDPRAIARRVHATILTYWLGHEASYLWIVTPQAVRCVELPSEMELTPKIRAYRQAVAAQRNDAAALAAGGALYALLVAPAAPFIAPHGQVVVIDDEELSKLNLETLPAPGAVAAEPQAQDWHYWIEDLTLTSAPSLAALQAMRAENPRRTGGGKLLLMGDAVQASEEYPSLPKAHQEMEMVRHRFAAGEATVLAREAATPAAYVRSHPGQYDYIHFVTHGVASPNDPMDGMIVLSRATAAEESYRLYAREILAHPLKARLVTVSACSGSGSRYFVGQGMVGLAWAFQRAGAENVIGTLWEISDDSTPRLMDQLYAGLQAGLPAAEALRQAKLSLLHSSGYMKAPFFWAPFQLYTGR
jgi:CHAT domain-containing protein